MNLWSKKIQKTYKITTKIFQQKEKVAALDLPPTQLTPFAMKKREVKEKEKEKEKSRIE